jgi:dipeptidase E
MKLLLLSNSTLAGQEYLSFAMPFIKGFIGAGKQVGAFVPYAAVTFLFDEYEQKVAEKFQAIGQSLISVHREANPVETVRNADFIVIGGGNTFHLLKHMQDNNLMNIIKDKVKSGTPYIGWSAGSNMACPGIYTTNDMPIVEPKDFKALNLINYQINPHYTDFVQPGHAGETRETRILEYCAANPDKKVLGLPEGDIIRVEGNQSLLMGARKAIVFSHGKSPYFVNPGDYLPFD